MKDSEIRLVLIDGMISIEGNNLYYSNIRSMYLDGNGHGLQTDENYNYNEILKLCDDISVNIYRLVDLINCQKNAV